MYTLYMHINRINGKKYIGITSATVEQRWKSGKGYAKHLPIGRAIDKYGWDNFEHLIIDEGLTEQKAKELEVLLIKEWHTQDSRLGYNLCAGGDGISGYHHSEETREKLSESATRQQRFGDKNPNFGHRWSDDMKRRASEARRGNYSEETKAKLSEAAKKRTGEKNSFFGKKHSAETKKKLSKIARDRNQFGEKNPNYGHKWTEEMKSAASSRLKGAFTEEARAKISAAAKQRTGERASFYGKKHSREALAKNALAHSKKVSQYDLDGNLVKAYQSIKSAATECGVSQTAIINCCKGKTMTCQGYKWKYVDV